jgi:hypothetical protein
MSVCQFKKSNNLSNFVSLPWKHDNPYYHSLYSINLDKKGCEMHKKPTPYVTNLLKPIALFNFSETSKIPLCYAHCFFTIMNIFIIVKRQCVCIQQKVA